MRNGILFLVIGLVFVTCGVAAADINDGLVALYPLDGDADDASGNGNHGTMVGGAFVEDRFGNPDSAIYLNGSGEYVNIGNGAKPPLPLTMAAWFMLDGFDVTLIRNDQNDTGSGRYGAALRVTDNGMLRAYLFQGLIDGDHRIGKYSADSMLGLGEWHHFAAVFRGASNIEIYLDGTEVSGSYVGGGSGMLYSGASGALGHHRYEANSYLHGRLDDVRVYNRALSPDEVASLMCSSGYTELSVAVTDVPAMIEMSSAWSTSFVIADNGPCEADSVVFDYVLPPWVQITSATPSQGSCSVEGNSVDCTLGDIAVGGSALIDVTAVVDTVHITHDMSVSSPHDSQDPSNNYISGHVVASCEAARLPSQTSPASACRSGERDLTTGLVAHYPFDGSWRDASGNGNHGMPYGGAALTEDRFGVSDDACILNGTTAYVDIGNGVKPSLPATVCAWFKSSSVGADGTLLITDNITSTQGHGLRLDVNGDSWTLGFIYTGTTSPALYQWASTPYSPGDWHHVAVVFHESDDADFYWDGSPVTAGISGAATAPVYSGRAGSLGRDAVGGYYYFDGALDDVRVYSRALSPGEILSLTELTADVTVEVDAPVGPQLGTDITYGVTVANIGDGDASQVSFDASFGPEQCSVVSATPSQGTCEMDEGSVACDLGSIGASAEATVSIVANLEDLNVEGAALVSSQICSGGSASVSVLTEVYAVCGTTSVPEGDGTDGANIGGARPNPFGAETALAFTLAEAQRVTIAVYDIAGRVVSRLTDEEYPAGKHAVAWEGSNDSGVRVASGVYFFVIRVGGVEKQQKMVLIK